MKKSVMLLLLCAMTVMLLSGCYFNVDLGFGNYMTGESYPNAENYETGAFTYDADEVQSVEVYWRSGKVEIVESDEDELTVNESGGEMDEEKSMHYLVEDGVLKIRFCASGAKIHVDPPEKHLTLEIPKGIDVSVHTTSAPIHAESLTQNSILFSAHSGNTELGSVDAADTNLSSSSGRICVAVTSAQALKCKTSSGSVCIEKLAADACSIETSSGNVNLGLLSADNVEIHTSSGKVNLTVPEYGAEVAYTTSSGNLHTNISYERKGDLYVFGDGEAEISVDSSSGNLNIEEHKQ